MYQAPLHDINFALREIAGLDGFINDGHAPELSLDLVEAILEEAAKFSGDQIAPLRMIGDQQGAQLKDGVLTMPKGWRDLYHAWIEGGWNAIAGPAAYGGQDLPQSIAMAALEMWNSGSLAFGIGPTLTIGAAEALHVHGAEALKDIYLEKLISGEWMGTMNLTEPQAGSDLNALRARAEPVGDGTYRVFGQKIYITYGEHDLTDNIVHLVLARLPDAPAGTRGLSLFLVPKFHVNEDGSLGARNDVFCNGNEHKMGIHASPTCTMIYGDGKFGDEAGAIGWLVGEENRGLACMFTMMNNARLSVGLQGVAVAESAFQLALNYAKDRKQGRAVGAEGEGMSAIIQHPDIQRELLTMKCLTDAARAISYCCAAAIDRANAFKRAGDADKAQFWQERANLLTPIAKAFSTDIGIEVASRGVQVFGGMGYIEETGAAMLMRDARIAAIYEGTNGIQAIDLVQRKLPQSGGKHIANLIVELREMVASVAKSDLPFGETAAHLSQAIDTLDEVTAWFARQSKDGHINEALAGATPALKLFGLVLGTTYLAAGAACSGEADRAIKAQFMATNMLLEHISLKAIIMSGHQSLLHAAKTL